MSVLKRLGNVARGKVLELGRTLGSDGSDGGSRDPDGDDERDPDRPPPRRPEPPAGGDVDKRALLLRLREEGLLTEEEFAAKLAALDAPPPSPPARARRL